MGLEIYLWKKPRLFLGTIESTASLTDGMEKLQHLTGVRFSEVEDTKLYLDHIRILDEYTEDSSEWKRIFQVALDECAGLIIIGD